MQLLDYWNRAKPHLPTQVISSFGKLAKSNAWLYRTILFRYLDAKDKSSGISDLNPPLPPARLRHRVSGSPDATAFLNDGECCSRDIQSALSAIGRTLDSFARILDFGCGCGRTLRHLPKYAAAASLNGADIDAKAISWCNENLDFGEFTAIDPLPPTPYPPATFDLIYAISVFTHLDEKLQLLWLQELKRIAARGGILLLTVDSSLVGPEGFTFVNSYEKGIFPKWYQNAYHSKEYVLKTYSSFFEILDYIPRGMNNHQDVVILRNGTDEGNDGKGSQK